MVGIRESEQALASNRLVISDASSKSDECESERSQVAFQLVGSTSCRMTQPSKACSDCNETVPASSNFCCITFHLMIGGAQVIEEKSVSLCCHAYQESTANQEGRLSSQKRCQYALLVDDIG